MKRTPLRRVSKQRAIELREYAKLRLDYLAAHPLCEWWLAENAVKCLKEGEAAGCPAATQIHHRNGRRGAHLNDVSHFMAVSAEAHRYIEDHKTESRRKGYITY